MSFFKKIKDTGAIRNSTAFSKVSNTEIDETLDSLDVDAIEIALEEAGIDSDIYSTFTSRPADKINLPEIVAAKATFIYNYYTRDERVRESSNDMRDRILSLDTGMSDEIFYQVKNKRSPRYVKIEIKPPKVQDNLISTVPLNKLGIDLEESMGLIVTEG